MSAPTIAVAAARMAGEKVMWTPAVAVPAARPLDTPSPIVGDAPHNAAVDWLRIIAVCAIIWFHARAPGGSVTFVGVHVLTAAAAYFAAASRSARSDRDVIVRRAARLLVPWLIFSAIHVALAIRSGHFQPWMLWTGGSIHLWFLPFIFVVSCAIAIGRRHGWFRAGWPAAIGWSVAGLVAVGIEVATYAWTIARPMPTWQVVDALPTALLGVAVWCLPATLGVAGVAMWSIAVNAIAIALWIGLRGEPGDAFPDAAAGAAIFALVRLIPVRPTTASAFAGRASYGVYLVQMLAVGAATAIVARLTHAAVTTDGSSRDALVASMAIVTSIVVVAAIERTPLRRAIG